ncbi:hypothetical protein HDU98_000401, partial [Podochytrium sp. JEL0797]
MISESSSLSILSAPVAAGVDSSIARSLQAPTIQESATTPVSHHLSPAAEYADAQIALAMTPWQSPELSPSSLSKTTGSEISTTASQATTPLVVQHRDLMDMMEDPSVRLSHDDSSESMSDWSFGSETSVRVRDVDVESVESEEWEGYRAEIVSGAEAESGDVVVGDVTTWAGSLPVVWEDEVEEVDDVNVAPESISEPHVATVALASSPLAAVTTSLRVGERDLPRPTPENDGVEGTGTDPYLPVGVLIEIHEALIASASARSSSSTAASDMVDSEPGSTAPAFKPSQFATVALPTPMTPVLDKTLQKSPISSSFDGPEPSRFQPSLAATSASRQEVQTTSNAVWAADGTVTAQIAVLGRMDQSVDKAATNSRQVQKPIAAELSVDPLRAVGNTFTETPSSASKSGLVELAEQVAM